MGNVTGIDLEIMESKDFGKLAKEVGDKAAKEFIEQGSEKLKAVITTATLQKQDATDSTKSNPEYQKAAEVVKDFNGALRDNNRPLDLRIKLASRILKNRKESNSIV